MTIPNLPVNIDQTYADSATDPSVAAHQQQHDRIHAFVNSTAGASPSTVLQRGRRHRLPLITRMQPTGQDNNWSAGTASAMGGTYRYRHVVQRSGTDLQLSFVNFRTNNGAEGPGQNNITVRAAIEYPAGTFHPVFFNGKRDVVIEPDATVWSEPLGIDVAAGDFIYSRTHVTVATSGQVWPTKMATVPGNGEGNNVSGTPVDLTTSGTVPTVSAFGYHPSGCYVTPNDPTVLTAWALVGDSITQGVGPAVNDVGYAVQALGTVPHHKVAQSSETALIAITNGNKKRLALLADCTHALVMMGTNDLAGGPALTVLQSRLLSLWTLVQSRGMKVYACTIVPRATVSSDGWTTVGGQTTESSNPTRNSFNTWLRAGAPIDPNTKAAVAVGTTGALVAGVAGHPLVGWFETANPVESAQNSGLWAANMTSDGTHPNQAGMDAMSTALVNAGIRTLG